MCLEVNGPLPSCGWSMSSMSPPCALEPLEVLFIARDCAGGALPCLDVILRRDAAMVEAGTPNVKAS